MQNAKRQLKMQNRYNLSRERQRGITIVEIIIVIAVVLTAFAGVIQLAQLSTRAEDRAKQDAKAYILAHESLEAARFVRDESWSTFENLVLDTPYYPGIQGNAWTLSPSDPGPIDGFSRWIEIHEVLRDTDDNIAPTGSPDDNTRLVESIVEWNRRGETESISMEVYFTNW